MIKTALHNILQDHKNPNTFNNNKLNCRVVKIFTFYSSVSPYKWYAIYNLIETAHKSKWKKYNITSENVSYL